MFFQENEGLTKINKSNFKGLGNLRSGVLFSGGTQKCVSVRVGSRERKKKRTSDTIFFSLQHESSAASPESGLLSNWSKKKKDYCMFDFQCNLKIRNYYSGHQGRCKQQIFCCSYFVS